MKIKKLKCFLDQEYHKTDELDQYGRKENTRIYGIPEDFASEEDDGERKLLEIAAKLDIPIDATNGNGNGLLFHMTQPISRSTIKAIACSKPTISEH